MTLTRREANAIFTRERARFADVYPQCALATLQWIPDACPTPPCGARNYADTDLTTYRIRMAVRVLRSPRARFHGLILHELGHVADKFAMAPGAERRADRIALGVTGLVVRYDRDLVQTTGKGQSPRPRSLPR